jgi:hypothetical protein
MKRLPILLLAVLCLSPQLHAQFKVEVSVKHRLYIAYEPILATVTITNLTGRDINLRDAPGHQWFGFQILNSEDNPIAPRDLNYKVDPLTIGAGQTAKRTVSLPTLFPMTEFGIYRVRATVYFEPLHRYFTSEAQNVEVTEGKTIWQQTVGVPDGAEGAGGYRQFTVMMHRLPTENVLYVRVVDKQAGLVYATFPIGRLAMSMEPEIMLDEANRLHVLHLTSPRVFTHTTVGLNGELLGQITYNETKTRPHLRKVADGRVGIGGGQMNIPVAQPVNGPPPPKLSDRPPGMPKL